MFEINLLGGFEVRREGVPIAGFYSNKARALLCYVALQQRTHTRESLAALLWQDVPEADAKTSLRQVLSNLRKLLGDAIEITRQTVAIRPNLITLDTLTFAQSETPTTSDLYRGDFLAGFYVDDAAAFEEWALIQRERMRLLAIERFQALAMTELAQGDSAAALATFQRLLEIEPWRESAHLQVMWLYVRQGRLLSALRQFELCRQMLDEELGVTVSAELSSLAARIEQARNRPANRLPESHGPFAGRQAELGHVSDWLQDANCRMLTIWGAGGLGKTRLATEWARSHAWAFLEGICFVDLVAVDSAEALLAALASALDLHTKQLSWDRIVSHLRDREMLIVLDNFEHLIAHAPLLSRLLDAPQVKLFVTSRELLNLREEWVLELAGLDYPRRQDAAVQRSGAMLLFVEAAARAGRPLDMLVDGDAVLQLCRSVDGMPLAIELLAAATRQQSCAQLVVALDGSMDALATRFRNWPTRHRSLRAVFDYSWQLLSDVERYCLAKLAVFVGGFSAEAAARVLGGQLDVVEMLVEKSLVRRAGVGRLSLHQTIHQYALEQAVQLAVDRAAGMAQAHFYADFCERQYGAIVLSDAKEFVSGMAVELGNVEAAWAWALEQGEWALVKALAVTLSEFYEWRGMRAALLEGLERALGAVPQDQPVYALLQARLANGLAGSGKLAEARALYEQACGALVELELVMALNGLSMTCFNLGDLAAAAGAARRAIALDLPESVAQATGYYRLAAALAQQGSLAEAQSAAERSIAINAALGSDWNLAIAQHELAPILAAQGDLAGAEEIFRRNLVLTARLGDQRGEMITCYRLGRLLQVGDSAESRQILRRGLAIASALDDEAGRARFESELTLI